MSQISNTESARDVMSSALARLDRALSALEQRIADRLAEQARRDGLFDRDRARLAEELDAARARERALEDIAAEASAALGRAASEVRAALSAEES
jgi:uncharacterized membrane protein YccC